ncbi:MAG: T9SS type A sorting domain-containing protein [Bacteroidales bacterium]|nr:T9SS type A sorting domain-containing protein [Bacteroidales bacterium]
MKKILLYLTFAVTVTLIVVNVNAQNLLTGGNMEDEGAWDTTSLADRATHYPELEFNYTSSIPTAGEGGCLKITGEMNPGGADGQIDHIIFQELTLTAGNTYYVTGAVRDITGGEGVFNFWSEVGFSLYNPADSGLTGTTFIMAINTWEGCGSNLDGTYQDDFCKYEGPFFRVPAEPEGEQTYYFFIQTGMWDNGIELVYYDFLIDELSVADSAEVLSVPGLTPGDNYLSLTHYPNPVVTAATISYKLPMDGNVTISMYNILGKRAEEIINEYQSAGDHNIYLDVTDLAPGLYFYSVRFRDKSYTQKMIIAR